MAADATPDIPTAKAIDAANRLLAQLVLVILSVPCLSLFIIIMLPIKP
jgi:hypothetical protein